MLVIRLARHGRKKRPTYRIVLQERDWAPNSKVLEKLGHMNPHTDPATVELKKDRIQYWLGQGAQPSASVHNILVQAEVIKGPKQRVVFAKKAAPEEAPAKETTTPAAEASADSAPEETPKSDTKEDVKES